MKINYVHGSDLPAGSDVSTLLPGQPGESVLVTGAAGTVGAFIVRELLARDYKVVAVDMPGANYPKVRKGESFQVRSGDLADPSFCEEAVEGVSFVMHAADVIGRDKGCGEPVSINVDAAKNLYEAARRAKVRLFVFFSSGMVYDFEQKGKKTVIGRKSKSKGKGKGSGKDTGKKVVGGFDESLPLGVPFTDYQRSKLEAENTLRGLAEARGPALTILRPAFVYGPGGKGGTAAGGLVTLPPLLYLLCGGRMVGFVGGAKMSWVHAEDVARAALFVMDNTKAWNETFNLADDSPLSLGEAFTAAVKAYGLPLEFVVPIPPTWVLKRFRRVFSSEVLFKIIDYLAGLAWKFVCLRHRCTDDLSPCITKGSGLYMLWDTKLSNDKLCSIGFRYRWPDLRSGYSRVLQWYLDRGWTPTGVQLHEARDMDVSFRLGWRGTHTYSGRPGGTHESGIDLEVKIPGFFRLSTNKSADVNGSCFFKTLADNVSCSGTLEMKFTERRLLLYLELRDNNNEPLHVRASTRVKPGAEWSERLSERDGVGSIDTGELDFATSFFGSMTSLHATVFDARGKEIARARLKLDMPKELVRILTSMRVSY